MTRVTDERAQWLGRFILPHEPALRAWLSRRTVGGLEAEDIVQEAYAKLTAMPSIEGIRDPRSYLFQVAKSVIATHLRGRKVVTITVADTDILDLADDEPLADVQLSDREELQRLAEAIAALPEPTRTIFRLRRIEQMPQRAIAKQLRMPESTVEKHVSRAFLHISTLLGRGGKRRNLASRSRVEVGRVEDAAEDSTRD
jgi:RNA polymerase sigma-70 factor (ECF subfamily)